MLTVLVPIHLWVVVMLLLLLLLLWCNKLCWLLEKEPSTADAVVGALVSSPYAMGTRNHLKIKQINSDPGRSVTEAYDALINESFHVLQATNAIHIAHLVDGVQSQQ